MTQLLPRWLFAGLLVAGLAQVCTADEMPAAETLYQTAPKGLPSEPAWGYWTAAPTSWVIVHNQFLERTKKGGVDIVFLGDSITSGWKEAASANWSGATPAPQAVNYGIGGDSTRQVIWRIRHGELDGLTPKVIVLMIGTNNLYADQNSGTNEQIADGVKTILALLQEKTPGARVLLMGVLPRQTKSWSDRIAALNKLLAGFNAPGRVQYRDAGAKFLNADGRPNTELYSKDLVHLNPAGYAVLNATVKPWIQELLHSAAR